MTVSELFKKYDFHDSSILKLDYSDNSKTLFFKIELCYWRQDFYTEEMDEIGEIELEFLDVSEINIDVPIPLTIYSNENHQTYNSLLKEDGKVGITFIVDLVKKYNQIFIIDLNENNKVQVNFLDDEYYYIFSFFTSKVNVRNYFNKSNKDHSYKGWAMLPKETIIPR